MLFAASFPWLLNRGIFMTPGDEEQVDLHWPGSFAFPSALI